MDFKDFTALTDDEGRRLDRLVKIILNDKYSLNVTQNEIYRLLRKNFIKLNGKKASVQAKIHKGDIISIPDFCFLNKNQKEENKDAIHSEKIKEKKIEIIYSSKDLFFVNKERGIAVQSSENGKISLEKLALSQAESNGLLSKDSISFKCGPLHRIDTNTTGIVTFSASLKGAQWFSLAIQNHILEKTYLGIVEGIVKNSCTWEDKIFCESTNSKTKNFQTVKISPDGKESLTKIKPLAYGFCGIEKITLLEFKIVTGRKHQIRAQSAFHGHPLLGDSAYGAKKIKFVPFFLHAWKINFPQDNELGLPQEITAPLPEDFYNFIKSNLKITDSAFIIK